MGCSIFFYVVSAFMFSICFFLALTWFFVLLFVFCGWFFIFFYVKPNNREVFFIEYYFKKKLVSNRSIKYGSVQFVKRRD